MSEIEELEENSSIDLHTVYDIPLQISVVLGTAKMKVSKLVSLSRGTVIELDRKVGEAIDVYVNDRLVAKGEIVLIDNKIGITLTEMICKDSNQDSGNA